MKNVQSRQMIAEVVMLTYSIYDVTLHLKLELSVNWTSDVIAHVRIKKLNCTS